MEEKIGHKYSRLKDKDALSIQQMEGYVVCLYDKLKEIERDIERYEDAIKWRRRFDNE